MSDSQQEIKSGNRLAVSDEAWAMVELCNERIALNMVTIENLGKVNQAHREEMIKTLRADISETEGWHFRIDGEKQEIVLTYRMVD